MQGALGRDKARAEDAGYVNVIKMSQPVELEKIV